MNEFPWPRVSSAYEPDGPRGDLCFTMRGVRFEVTLTGDIGMDTGRDRYRVVCLTCNAIVHRNTTSATVRCREHLDEVHGERV